ncbi:hypothetical protein [Streptomyces sp. DH24]|uniref:hypothetical protein n=1 Tax=Streptomyces sp. DH24 TaxID=3040123 RepID=UPI002440FC31|nr:hypothetical protein [Streptomyces sp. DH24]MDG9715911.1 hypothetical protein [Streptomyces sp. DH24]
MTGEDAPRPQPFVRSFPGDRTLGRACPGTLVAQLESEGVAKFALAWQELLDAVTKSLNSKGVDAE